jgi:uncharacterized repeat protein (TIGR03803 family)
MMSPTQLKAQYTILHLFTNTPDGDQPYANMVISSNTLYGTTYEGGTNSNGTIFCINTDGSGYQELHAFAKGGSGLHYATNADGEEIDGDLLLANGTLYGTAKLGGTNDNGTIFSMSTNGSNFTVLHTFSTVVDYPANSDGANPESGLIISGSTLFGGTQAGGANGAGTIFMMSTNGNNFTVMHNFVSIDDSGGSGLLGDLTLDGNFLYGEALYGGYGDGVVFSLCTNDDDYTLIHTFDGYDGAFGGNVYSGGGLLLVSNTLYGAMPIYDEADNGDPLSGEVFSMATNGFNFTIVCQFTNYDGQIGTTPDDPVGDLVLSGNTLYGTSDQGGTNATGLIFSTAINGGGAYTVLYNFPPEGYAGEPCLPEAGMVLSGNTLYGTAAAGLYGAVFSLQIPLSPAIITAITYNPGNTDTLDVLSTPNSTNVVQATASLSPPVIWVNISTNAAPSSGTWQFTDTGAGGF